MDFRKRLIEELDLSIIAANTMYSVYIDVCEKIAKEYAKEQVELVKNNVDLADVIKSGEHICKFYVNANWTGYSRCECGKKHKPPAL